MCQCRATTAGSTGHCRRGAVRHGWLSEAIRGVHVDSHGVYGAHRVHTELTLGHGITVGHGAVELLIQRAGLRRVGDATSRTTGYIWPAPVPLHPQRRHRQRSSRSPVPTQRARPSVGHRHHRTPHPRSQGLLRSRVRRVQPASGRLVDRLVTDRGASGEHARDSDRSTSTGPRIDSDPFGTRKANTLHSHSLAVRSIPGCCRQWVRSGTTTTMPSSSRSGARYRSNSLTGSVGAHEPS